MFYSLTCTTILYRLYNTRIIMVWWHHTVLSNFWSCIVAVFLSSFFPLFILDKKLLRNSMWRLYTLLRRCGACWCARHAWQATGRGWRRHGGHTRGLQEVARQRMYNVAMTTRNSIDDSFYVSLIITENEFHVIESSLLHWTPYIFRETWQDSIWTSQRESTSYSLKLSML